MNSFFNDNKKAVVLLSGGIDSSTTLAIAEKEGYELYAMSFNYHQRHMIELASAKKVADAYQVKKHLIVSFDLRDIGGSALTSDMDVPKMKIPNSEIPVTYVPARNTIFLSFALAWAEVLEAGDIFIGANAIDYSGYPDCRPEYLKAFEDMANLATKASVEKKLRFSIKSPLISLKKSQIIEKGIGLGIDYSLTWSCYDPQPVQLKGKRQKTKDKFEKSFKFVPCGLCDSCKIREKGFSETGISDPLLSITGQQILI